MNKNRMRSMALTFLVLIGIAAVGVPRDRGYAHRSVSAGRYGGERGYRDGYRRGRQDRNRGIRYDYRTDEYRAANRGFEVYMGDPYEFQEGYRSAYREGYEDACNGRQDRWEEAYRYDPDSGPYDTEGYGRDQIYVNGRRGYYDVASDTGYRDGLEQGEKDRRHHKRFRPEKNDRYEDADHGYHREYGPKDEFRREYRDAFLRGYEEGYGRWR